MKVLLTGPPRSGKTTLLNRFLQITPDKQGFVAAEILEDGTRAGFQLVSSFGRIEVLASVKSTSPIRVSNYGVELEKFEKFLTSLPSIKPDTLLYIDEIGRMELYSRKFKDLVLQYLAAKNPFIGTIASNYSDDFTVAIKARPEIEVIEVTRDNRVEVLGRLAELFSKN